VIILHVLKLISKIFLFGFLSFIICYIGINIYALITPKLNITNNGTYYLFDNKDELVYQGSSTSSWVNIENIDDKLLNATIAIEDKKFYNHFGFDILRIGKAMITNIKTGQIVQGASTITQQLVKNLYLDFGKTWKRKIEEAFLTIITEIQYDKEEILEAYLNTIDFGAGNYGIKEACNGYLDKEPSEMTLYDSTMLAGIPNAPSVYAPTANPELTRSRQKKVISDMVEHGYLSQEQANRILE